MNLRGNIRHSSGGIDIAFPHDGYWHSLEDSPLKRYIEVLYHFVLGGKETDTINGRVVKKTIRRRGDQTSTSVMCSTPFATFTLTRYSHDLNGKLTPSDKVRLDINILSVQGNEISTNYRMA